ncbi:MAG: penicillin-binding protein activator LpoB [Treponema sp.]|nr:penicillin-binding protein activator LpoB [Treponema sp.]
MKISLFTFISGFLLVLALFSCTGTPKVQRVDADKQIDVSGNWNDTDARKASESLIGNCLDNERVANYIRQFSAQNNGRLPTVIVGSFRNNTSEHIDTSIISKAMEIAIVNSGKLNFVAGGDTRSELRAERDDQQFNASDSTASSLANERGANFMLTGAIKMIEDRAGKIAVRSYFVSAELTNIETNERFWMGENNDIKKRITRSKFKF